MKIRLVKIKGLVGGAVLLITIANVGCGGGSNPGSAATPLTQAEALGVTADLFAGMAGAPLSIGATPQARFLQGEAALIRNARVSGVSDSSSVPSIVLPRAESPHTALPTFTFACRGGGSITVAGTYTGTFSATTWNVTENVIETPNNCNDGRLIINGNPNIDINATVTLASNIFTDVTTMTGGFTAGGNSCVMNVTLSATVNELTNAVNGTISGSVCGVNVSGTF